MQPKVTAPYRYFHKMQSAYGFGPKMMAKHSKNSVPSSWNFKQYPVWNDFMQGPITRAGFLQHMDNATAERGIQQRRDLYADVSDQLVRDCPPPPPPGRGKLSWWPRDNVPDHNRRFLTRSWGTLTAIVITTRSTGGVAHVSLSTWRGLSYFTRRVKGTWSQSHTSAWVGTRCWC